MQPMRPHGHRAPPRLITMWPISPAAWRPVQALPFRTRPPPTPVPQKTPRIELVRLAGAQPELGHRPDPHVVAEVHGRADLVPEVRADRHRCLPVRDDVARARDGSRLGVDRARRPDAHAVERGRLDAGGLGRCRDRLGERPDDALLAGVLGRRHAVLSEHLGAAVHDDRLDLRASEIDASAHASYLPRRVGAGRYSAARADTGMPRSA